MKKPSPAPAAPDQVAPSHQSKNRRAAKPPPFVTRLAPTPLGKRQAVSYVPGEKPRSEPAVLPRLFVRGLGGSIKLDLGGLGIDFSEAAFAHLVADDSLSSLHVCRGDIALIEPAVRSIHAGNLVLLEIDGCPVIRRLRRQKRLWMLNAVDGCSDDAVLFPDQGIQGVVVGFMRLFDQLRPVKYAGTDANYSTGFEVPTRPRKGRGQATSPEKLRGRARLARSWADIRQYLHANGGGKGNSWLNEIDQAIRYGVRPDKR